jgi:hypothetical protein
MTTAISEHRWPARALTRDYLLAAAGFAVCFPPLLFVEWSVSVVVILGGLSALFAWLALRAYARQRAVVRLDGDGITRGSRSIPWRSLRMVKLRRYGARRKSSGVTEMTLAGEGVRIGIDSLITDFLPLARTVFTHGRAHGADMDEATLAAFAALGIDTRKTDQDARR